MGKLQHYAIDFIYYTVFIVGSLGLLYGLLWLGLYLIEQICRILGCYRIIIEFAWDRAKYKSDKKE